MIDLIADDLGSTLYFLVNNKPSALTVLPPIATQESPDPQQQPTRPSYQSTRKFKDIHPNRPREITAEVNFMQSDQVRDDGRDVERKTVIGTGAGEDS